MLVDALVLVCYNYSSKEIIAVLVNSKRTHSCVQNMTKTHDFELYVYCQVVACLTAAALVQLTFHFGSEQLWITRGGWIDGETRAQEVGQHGASRRHQQQRKIE